MDCFPLHHILYLGRNGGLAHSLRSILAGEFDGGNTLTSQKVGAIQWQVVTNQKAALRSINGHPPGIILIETSAHAHSRRHFCETVRLRLPDTLFVAVGAGVSYDFPFNALIQTPLNLTQALDVFRSLQVSSSTQTVSCGVFHLVISTRLLRTPLGEHTLTPKQCALLKLFMLQPNRVIKRSDIMRTIWDTSYLDDTRTLDVHIRWLREIIEPDPSTPLYLITERGVGYQLVMPGASAAIE
jgi:DNA-binding winged helix-turn-helix (wHTH) protein